MEDDQEIQEEGNCYSWMFFQKAYPCKSPLILKRYARGAFLFFLILAIVTFLINSSVKSEVLVYANSNHCQTTKLQTQKCSVTFNLEDGLSGPVYVLYFVQNIYINHKRFLDSYSPQQLAGNTIDSQKAQEQCFPIIYNKDLPVNMSWGGSPLDPNAIASPCGLKPALFFNDSFKIYDGDGTEIKINQKQIVRTDNMKMKRQPDSANKQWIDPENQHFINYMLTGSLMTKKRLWGKIEEGLKAGQYTLLTENNYKVHNLGIEKGIQLTTTTVFGGANLFFPVAFLILALISLVYSIVVGQQLDEYEEYIMNMYKND